MIATFKVKNFRSFKEYQELSFEPSKEKRADGYCCVDVRPGVRLLKTALIYGANASGKTNILLALETLRHLIKSAPQDINKSIAIEPFLLDGVSKREPTFFSITFYLNGEKYVYDLSVDKNRIYTEDLCFYPKSQPARLYYRSYNPNTDSTEIEFGPQVEIGDQDKMTIRGNALNNCTVLAALGKSNVATSRLNKVFQYFSRQVKDIIYPIHDLGQYTLNALRSKPEMKDFLIEELQESDFNICNIEIDSQEVPMPAEIQKVIESDNNIPEEAKREILKRPVLTNQKLLYTHCNEYGAYTLPQDLESRGTLRYTGLAALLHDLRYKDSVVMIDEAEAGLHYDLLSHFIGKFLLTGDRQSQLIITTHDTSLLDEDFVRRDSVWFAEKNNNGESRLSRLSNKKLHTNVSAYNAYKKGDLGGKPLIKTGKINREEVNDFNNI